MAFMTTNLMGDDMTQTISAEHKMVAAKAITKSHMLLTKENSPHAVNAQQYADRYVYYSPRPAWVGFFKDALDAAGVTADDIQTHYEGSYDFSLSKPLPVEFLAKFELLPLSQPARFELAKSILDNTTGVAVRSDDFENVSSITNALLTPTLTKYDVDGSRLVVGTQSPVMSPANELVDLLSKPQAQLMSLDRLSSLLTSDKAAELKFIEALSRKQGVIIDDIGGDVSADGQLSHYLNRTKVAIGDAKYKALISEWDKNANQLSASFGVLPRRVMSIIDTAETVLTAPVSAATPEVAKLIPKANVRKWIDLSDHNLFIGEQPVPSSTKNILMLVDLDAKFDPAALASVGFYPLSTADDGRSKGVYTKRGDDQSLNVKALRTALNLTTGVRVVETTTEAIRATLVEKSRERYQTNMSAMLMAATPLGLNYLGYEVLASDQGRFIRTTANADGKKSVYLEGTTAGRRYARAAFMHADDAKSLRLVADGMVLMMRQGKRFKPSELANFATIAFKDQLDSTTVAGVSQKLVASDSQVFALQEALEASAYRSFMNADAGFDHDAFKSAKNIYYALPTATLKTAEAVNLQQYSTPLPMAVVAQRLLFGNDVVEGKSVLEPTAGNGGLLVSVPKTVQIGAIELDGKRLDAIKELNHPNLTTVVGDAAELNYLQALGRNEPFDYTITNPPFGAMPEPKSFDVMPRVAKYDHYIPLKSLAARKDVGRTVIILGADSPRSDGTLNSTSQYLMNYLAHHYELESAVEVDGRLYSRQGSSYNVRMIVVGDRRAVPDASIVAPSKLSIISDYEQLWEWSTNTIEAYGQLKNAAPAPVEQAAELTEDEKNENKRVEILARIEAITESPEEYALTQAEVDQIIGTLNASDLSSVSDVISALESKIALNQLDKVIDGDYDVIKAVREQAAQADALDNDLSVSTVPSVEHPWMLTKLQWEAQWNDYMSNPSSVTARDHASWLTYGVHEWVRERISIHESGDVVLSEAELQALQAQLDVDVTHRDVVDKALGEGMAVPQSVLNAYPEFEERTINDFQVPYQAQSKVGEPSGMIPINMASSTYDALRDLVNVHGDIDEYVARKLQYDVAELGQYFSPEQVDALGLSIRAIEDGRGMINADQTGMGKGRWVAGMLRYAKLSGKQPIFTTIKPELFTDIFRDINDIGSSHLFKNVFIFNNNTKVVQFGTENETLFKATSKEERDRAIALGGFGENRPDIVLATYSQFQIAQEKNKKTKLLTDLSRDAVLLMDESHVASGASNIGAAMSAAVSVASGVLYASSTPLKGVKNFGIYSKIFPASVDIENLPDTLAKGGEALMEAISANMARDGVIIRREHDLSQLTFTTVFPDAEEEKRNRAIADQFGAIMSRMAYMAGDVKEMAVKLNKQYKEEHDAIPADERLGNRMQAESMNFGSRMYSLNRQMLLGIKIQSSINQALTAIAEGRKPVFAVENTGESLTRQVVARRFGLDQLAARIEDLEVLPALDAAQEIDLERLKAEFATKSQNLSLDSSPQFRELLEIMLERMRKVKVTNGYGKVTFEEPTSDEFNDYYEETLELIRAFPDMSLTPVDDIKNALAMRGLNCGEVSGRGISLKYNPSSGKLDVLNHPKVNAVSEVAGFQNGRLDAIIITRAGSTGISLHATNRNDDSDARQREFIVLQKASNIAEYLQWLGRVNRKDQVVTPIIASIESGLPAETRLTMMHNAKLRKMSANTSSNRDNANLQDMDVDFLNSIGNDVAYEWFIENPDMAELFDIDVSKDDDNDDDEKYINRLTGRISLIPSVDRQERIYEILAYRFKEKLEMLLQQGINPFQVDVHDWKASVVSSESLESNSIERTDSSFDDAVSIVTVKYEINIQPIRADYVDEMIETNLNQYKALMAVNEDGSPEHLVAEIKAKRNEAIREALPTKVRQSKESTDTILRQAKDDEYPGARELKAKTDYLINNLPHLKPGRILVLKTMEDGEIPAVVTKVTLPSDDRHLFLAGKYGIEVAVPTEASTRRISMATLYASGTQLMWGGAYLWDATKTDKYSPAGRLRHAFNDAPEGKLERTRLLLQGNTYRACEISASQSMGHPVLYTNTDGERVRAVLLNSRITSEQVKAVPIPLQPRHAEVYFEKHKARYGAPNSWGDNTVTMYSKPVHEQSAATAESVISITAGRFNNYNITIPGAKSRSGNLMADSSIVKNGKPPADGTTSLDIDFIGKRSVKSASIPNEMLHEFLKRMHKNDHVSKWYVAQPDPEVLKDVREHFAALNNKSDDFVDEGVPEAPQTA